MSFDSSKYRSPNDTEKEWKLKKMFVDAHNGKFEEARLVCLAQCFANIQTLGVRYPDKLMKQMKELTADFEHVLKDMKEQDDKMRKMHKKFDEIKFIPSTSNEDRHFKNDVKQNLPVTRSNIIAKLDSIPLPLVPQLMQQQPPQQVQILKKPQAQQPAAAAEQTKSSTHQLNNAFNKLNVNTLLSTPTQSAKPTEAPATNRTPRNALLNSLLNPDSKPFVPSLPAAKLPTLEPYGMESIEKLKKIDKLREQLRTFKRSNRFTFDNQNDHYYVDVLDLMQTFCNELGISIECRVSQTVECTYVATLYLEKYKLVSSSNKKKNKCKLFCHKDTFHLLTSDCILAVRSTQKLGQPIEYELYNVNGNTSMSHAITEPQAFSYSNNEFIDPAIVLAAPSMPVLNDNKASKQLMIKETLHDFIIFIPSNLVNSNDESLINERNSIAVLTRSCAKNHVKLELELTLKSFENSTDADDEKNVDGSERYKCKCFINKLKVAVSHGKTKQEAKRIGALRALNALKKQFPIIQEESRGVTDNNANNIEANDDDDTDGQYMPIKISKNDVLNSVYPELGENQELNKFSESKLGNALLSKWGWKGQGHGIGKLQQGIAEPIYYQTYLYRQGLGSKEMVPFSYAEDEMNEEAAAPANVDISKANDRASIMKNLQKFLQQYLHSKVINELQFEAAFSNEERRLVHQEAHHMGLKTQSVGVGDGRYLTISKKRSPIDILEELKKNSGQFGKYKLIDEKQ